jgi:hypothetical protein
MPAALIPIISAVVGAAGVGTSIYGMTQSPSAPKPTPAAPAGPSVDATKAATLPQALSIMSATEGGVSPDYTSTNAPIFAGTAGGPNTSAAMQQILQQIFGKGGSVPSLGGGTSPGTAPSNFTPTGSPVYLGALAATPGVSDFLQKIIGGG